MEIPPFARILIPNVKVHYKGTCIPPEVVSRTSKAPFLFKCCRVGYDKETNRLEIRKGEYVGKRVTTSLGSKTNMQYSDYVDIMVDVDMDEYDDLLGKSNRYVTSTEKGAEKAMASSKIYFSVVSFTPQIGLKKTKETIFSIV